jgi:NifU-like protein involved in Fe-S cluster formation
VGNASLGGRAPHFTIYVNLDGGRVTKACFQTTGCGYAIAACSALTELVAGKTIAECQAISVPHLVKALDGMPEHKRFCARLAIDALRDALGKSDVKREDVTEVPTNREG